MEMLVAERKAFLSKRKLTYKCRLRVDDAAHSVTFWEMLVEKGSGVSGGDDMAPGFGFKKEIYRTKGKELSGGIEEASSLFGKDFDFNWDYAVVRRGTRRGRGRWLQPQRGAQSQVGVTRGLLLIAFAGAGHPPGATCTVGKEWGRS